MGVASALAAALSFGGPGAQAQDATPHLRQLPPLPHRRGHSPCGARPGVMLFAPTPAPITTPSIPPPVKAVTEHVHGCAGIRFHIAPDGKARDITVVMEFPGEYEFGDTARRVIAGTTWAPRHDDAWHYVNLAINPPTPAQNK